MSAVDPTGLFTENFFERNLTPSQQAVLGAGLSYVGAQIVRIGIGSTVSVVGIPAGAITTALGAALMFEGGTNAVRGLNRITNKGFNDFDEQLNTESSLLFRLPARLRSYQNGANKCHVIP